MNYLHRSVLIALILCSVFSVSAQDTEPKEVARVNKLYWNEKKLLLPEYGHGQTYSQDRMNEDNKGGRAGSAKSKADNISKRSEQNESLSDFNQRNISIPGWVLQLMKWLFVLMGVFAISYILFQLYINKSTIANNEPIYNTMKSIEEDLLNSSSSDLDSLLKEALDGQNYRIAIRILYLQSLKELSNRSLINWRKEKTNSAYLQEIIDHSIYPDFRLFTNKYEETWYGLLDLNESSFREARNIQTSIFDNIQKSA